MTLTIRSLLQFQGRFEGEGAFQTRIGGSECSSELIDKIVSKRGAGLSGKNAGGSTCGLLRSHHRSYLVKQSGLHVLALVSSWMWALPLINVHWHTKH